ncbi:Crp/Fnr family transcriptional regulator [Rhodocytophaga rosea]|uniref:Crp/Fnr family transcriptional regulator n=1 Tax=Rhodocytophaga rosea TaxID=2704465 RepID=A0A6C0GN54_9BACT|nr:Crp/Fnr family transcriptional regulator [Rhodocytophaga rosea]QHT69274.1 Crp/Fnr family transcriptional regulator [Rhodocytophaga rosea]
MCKQLLDHLSKFVHLDITEQDILQSYLQVTTISRKDFLLKEGQVCSGMYFVLEGCFRLYSVTDSGAEQILQFGIENWWISDYRSFENRVPSPYYIQAVEDSQVVVISSEVYEELFHKIPKLERYFRLMMQRAYTAALRKMELFLSESAEARYQQFSKNFPDFVQRIPQYMLASFLGFTPEFLSMLRAKNRRSVS